jgi:4-diphosphocytidyl-2-C-methyl-D-erythritol kinase
MAARAGGDAGRSQASVAAPAKVNLSLLVGPARPDGFHEIFSLMLPVTLADLVTVAETPGGDLSVACETCPGEENLAARMVRELERRLARRFEVAVEIVKRIPVAAGLAGGSSDAAATLVALERLFGLELSPRLRYEIAAAVGSDVPFFLWPGPQLAMGRGTVLREVELPEPLHVVIALPDVGLSTAAVYRWRDDDGALDVSAFVDGSQRLVAALPALGRPRDLAPLIVNDLEPAVVARHPEIGELRSALVDAGAFAAAMSGSGSSVFGLFVDEARAQAALRAVAPARAFYVTDLQPRAERPRRGGPSA